MDDQHAWCTCKPFNWKSASNMMNGDAPIAADRARSLEHAPELSSLLGNAKPTPTPSRCCGVPCRHCSCLCACFCCSPIVLGVVAVVLFLQATESLCAVGSYDPQMVVPENARKANLTSPMELATSETIKTHIPLDFTGVWWMRWTEPQVTGGVWTNFTYSLYSSLRIEELVSFAGYASNVTGEHGAWFPARLGMQTGLQRRSGFSDSIFGRIMMMASSGLSPTALLNIDFENETSGKFTGFGDTIYMTKLDEDQWLRTTKVAGDRFGPPAYRFTRIVAGDGKPHPKYYPMFLKHMGSARLRVWTTNSHCYRHGGSGPSMSSCKSMESLCDDMDK